MHILFSSNDIIPFVFSTHPNVGGIQEKKNTIFREFTVGEFILLQPSQIPTERSVWIFFFFHLINLKRLLWEPGFILVNYSTNQSLNCPGAEGVHTITRGYSWL